VKGIDRGNYWELWIINRFNDFRKYEHFEQCSRKLADNPNIIEIMCKNENIR
jgi:hypothetical protein